MEELNKFLPAVWSHNNPIDVIGDASAELYAKTLEVAGRDPNSDGLLVILTPQAMTDATATAEKLKAFGHVEGKPVLASWMGGDEVAAGEAILNRADIPTFAYPDTAAMVFTSMWQYSENLRALYETPVPSADPADLESGRAKAESMIDAVKKTGRTILTEAESKDLLGCYGIPTVVTKIAKTEAAAAKVAKEIGFPIVLKLFSETITHKTDVGGVQLNLKDEAEVRKAFNDIKTAVTQKKGAEHFQGVTVQKMIKLADGYEIILGSSIDPQFGPVLLFGMGGQLVEVFKDRALALPPLNTTLARQLIRETTISHALKGVRGRKPIDKDALASLLVRFSELVAEQPRIAEIDINPLLASPERIIALDARVVLHPAEIADADLPRLAIRPYPHEYELEGCTDDGVRMLIRPVRPEDEPTLARFHAGLSTQTVVARYGIDRPLAERTAHDRLTRICFADYDRQFAIVAEVLKDDAAAPEFAAIARVSRVHASDDRHLTMTVADAWQRRGVGACLIRAAIAVAKGEGVANLVSELSPRNARMRELLEAEGFTFEEREGVVVATLPIK
jgi:acetyltransferase